MGEPREAEPMTLEEALRFVEVKVADARAIGGPKTAERYERLLAFLRLGEPRVSPAPQQTVAPGDGVAAICPFCRASGAKISPAGRIDWTVECENCGARGPRHEAGAGALALWNAGQPVVSGSPAQPSEDPDGCRVRVARVKDDGDLPCGHPLPCPFHPTCPECAGRGTVFSSDEPDTLLDCPACHAIDGLDFGGSSPKEGNNG